MSDLILAILAVELAGTIVFVLALLAARRRARVIRETDAKLARSADHIQSMRKTVLQDEARKGPSPTHPFLQSHLNATIEKHNRIVRARNEAAKK